MAFLIGLLLIGQLSLRPIYSTTISDYAFFAALVTMLSGLALSRRAKNGFVPGGVAVGAALFTLGACVSAFSSETTGASIGITARFLYLMLVWFWLATIVLRRTGDVRAGVALWVVSLSVSGAAAIAQLVLGDVIPSTHTAFGRMTGTAQHVNDLGGSAAVALPAAAALALQEAAGRATRLLGVAATLLITVALILSGSLGGMLAAAFGIAVAAVLARRKGSFATAAVVVAVATFVTWYYQAAEGAGTFAERLQAVSGSSGTLAARVDVSKLAWHHIADHPLVGVGLGFDPASPGSELPDLIHNAFLGVWYEGGLLALVGLVIISLSCIRAGLRAVLDAESPDERVLAASLVGSFAAYLAFGLGEPTLYARYGWVPVALFLALRARQLRLRQVEGMG